MAASWTSLLSNEAITQMVGHEAFARAMVYARSGHVHDVELDDEAMVISGRVKGTYRDGYRVTVHLASSRTGAVTAYRSQCSCPVAQDCKHAAAVLVVARHLAAAAQLVERPEWEKALDKLMTGTPAPVVDIAPLALEFGVERIPAFRGYVGRQDLRIRPARLGKAGNWVRSGIGWDDLDFVARSYVPEHRELLLQFRAAAGAGARYALPRSAWLSLGAVGSGFWGLLDQAATSGLTMITAKPLLGPIQAGGAVSVGLDVRRTPDGLELGPRVTLEDRELPLAAVGVLGEPAHGLFWLRPGEEGNEELVVARLTDVIGRDLRQMVVDARTLSVPAADEARFMAEFAVQLRQKVELTSTDGSVRLPSSTEPRLALDVDFQPGHRLGLDWRAIYDMGEELRRFPLAAPVEPRSIRDLAAERELIAGLELEAGPPTELTGLAAARFVDQVLPELTARGVEVDRQGDVLDYRQNQSAPVLQVTPVPRADSSDWFDLHLTVALDGEEVPFDELFVALTRGEEFMILETGVYFGLDRPEFIGLRELIEEAKALDDHRPALTVNRFDASLWEDLVSLGAEIDQSARWTQTVRGLADAGRSDPPAVPATLQAELRPYQLDGYRWLHYLWSHDLGGILADDMGLGKTLQALAVICQAKLTRPDGPPFLVVAPTTVVSNWLSEAARFAPELTVVALAESTAKRRGSVADAVAGADLVITSYALLRIEIDRLVDQSWSGMILDEAQFVKNHRARTHQCAQRIVAPFKLAITGTPLENSLMDLWALLSLTAPGLFPHADRFAEYYRRPIERHGDTARLHQLQRRIRPLMLRRTKASVAAELPPKAEQVVTVDLDPRHRRLYQTHLQRERQKVLGLIDDLDHNRFTVLRSLTLLRRLSLDPALVDQAHSAIPAAKVEVLVGDLSEIVQEGHQALVFSQFTSFLGRIRTRLDDAGISYAYLDGRTRQRDRVVDRFRSGDASVFLISLKAGGFGLNLTEASYCFVLDPWWNPATEAQAVDRTHRIGQTKPVMVYRLVARGTIEEKVMALKARKSELFGSVFSDDDGLASPALTAEEIRGLIGA
ncbi:MAG TPA: DEAD/DEAH box helicase [Propionibacteriaceae bacterium]|nr:DEAD/DEAH box helicase [Propionibacteriaceae bacterium]